MIKLAIFASGSGSNAENLVQFFKEHANISISMLIGDRKDAFVFERMKKLGVPAYYKGKADFENGSVLKLIKENKIDFIILAGFLKLVPASIIHSFPNKIINIHPALLPSYGGKGMYGMHVHRAVVEAGEKKSGITIHFVNEHFDKGEIISQFITELTAEDTPETVAAKIHELEMKYFPRVVEQVVMQGMQST